MLVIKGRLAHVDCNAIHDAITYMQKERLDAREGEQTDFGFICDALFIQIFPYTP